MVSSATIEAPSQGWQAQLALEFSSRQGLTILSGNRHTGPLRVQRTLYPEAQVCHACLLHPPGGVVGGDRLRLEVAVKSDATALITTPGATKFYRSGGARAIQESLLSIERNAWLEWLPQESIVYPEADARIATRVNLAEGAGFMGWETVCIGLPACGRPFTAGRLETSIEIHRGGRPIFKDRLMVADQADLRRPAGLRGCSVSATFVATGGRPEMLAPLREILQGDETRLTGITLMEDLLVARYLGDSSAEAKKFFHELWSWLRPNLSGRKACPPRIWET
ncbi:MAG: urease accessory protein UreD [Desulfobacterales bacterium]|nr:urease accessory protein UreD [Desulfobacterales bacterium]